MTRTLLSWQDDLGVDHVVKCDAVLSLIDELDAEVTDHPIENGSEISDHVIHKPKRLSLEVHQGNAPAEPDQGFSRRPLALDVAKNSFKPQGLLLIHSAAGALIGSILGKTKSKKAYILQPDTEVDRVVELHDKLIEAWNQSYQLTLNHYGRTYPDYVLTSLSYTREGQGKGGLGQFKLGLRTLRTVSTATTELPNPEDLHAKPQTDRGSKPGATAGGDGSDLIEPGSLAYDLVFGKSGAGAAFGGAIQ
jgi:hypothetical protein